MKISTLRSIIFAMSLCSISSGFSQSSIPIPIYNKQPVLNTDNESLKNFFVFKKNGTPVRNKDSTQLNLLTKLRSGDPLFPLWQFKKQYEIIDSFNTYLYNNAESSALQSVSTQVGKNSFIGAEFANFFFGVVRVGVGGYFQTTGDSATDNNTKSSFQKILSSGGNFTLNFTVPTLIARSCNEQNHFGIYLFTTFGFSSASKFSFDSTIGFTSQSGIDFHADFASNRPTKGAMLTFDIPVEYCWGAKQVLTKMGLPDFGMIQLRGSLSINNLLSFYVQYPFLTTSSIINNGSYQVLTGGIKFSPSQILHSSSTPTAKVN